MKRITFVQLQEFFKKLDSEIIKHEKGKHYFIVNNNKKYHVYLKHKLIEIKEEVEGIGLDEFILKYNFKAIDEEKKQLAKIKKLELKALKEKEKEDKKDIDAMLKEKADITIKILGLIPERRNSKDHLKLRARLHEIQDTLNEYGYNGNRKKM